MTTLQSLRTQLCAITGALLLGATATQAQLPMSYQGMITTIATNQPASGSYTMTFRLYTSPTGGTPVWQETQQNILLNQGIFNVQLGAATPLKLPFSEQYYLGVTIADGTEMEPRTALTSVPYAYRATTSDSALTVADGAITLAKIDTAGSSFGQVLTRTMSGLAWIKPLAPAKTMAAMVDHDGSLTGDGDASTSLLGITYPQVKNAANATTAWWQMTNTSNSGGAGLFAINNANSTAHALTASNNNTLAPASNPGTALYIPSGSLLATGTTGKTPASGSGTRLMWIPYKSAFRAGTVATDHWDDDSVGQYSLATNYLTTAYGQSAVAMGEATSASGSASTALGYATKAHAAYSIAMGEETETRAQGATALGYRSIANGSYSLAMGVTSTTSSTGAQGVAMGESSHANNVQAVAMGKNSTSSGTQSLSVGLNVNATNNQAIAMGAAADANGTQAIAVGYNVTADGNNSVALGSYASTNSQAGSFVFGDASTTTPLTSTTTNEVSMRAAGGYLLHTDASLTTGLRLGSDGSLLMEGTSGSTPTSGTGKRMMWIPDKEGAFRAGNITGSPGNQWDAGNIGNGSVAMGHNTKASGDYSLASGENSISTATGAIAIGTNCEASGSFSFAAGSDAKAQGYSSTALGAISTASGFASTSIGSHVTASGDYSTAMGSHASTDGKVGAFAYGDNSSSTDIKPLTDNEFVVRADHIWLGINNGVTHTFGRYLEVYNGAYLSTGGSWTNASDRNVKADFQPVNYRSILDRVIEMPVTTWRYKADVPSTRHIGPMAQDFQAMFNLSDDSTHIGTVDADGVALASIKGLYEVVQEKGSEVDVLRQENAELRRRLERLERLLLKEQNNNLSVDRSMDMPLK